MYNPSFQLFFDSIESKNNINIEFIYPGSMREYQQYIKNNLKKIDLALIPSHWLYLFADDASTIHIPRDIYGSINAERQHVIESHDVTMIPYLLDPPVVIHKKGVDGSRKGLTHLAVVGS